MKEEELNKVIQVLEQNSSDKNAFFEFDYDEMPDYGCIRANKDGIITYAKELLRATKEFKFDSEHKENEKNVKIKTGDWYVDDEFILPYINPVFKKRIDLEKKKPIKETLKSRITGVIAILTLISIIGCIVVGFVTIVNWIFN